MRRQMVYWLMVVLILGMVVATPLYAADQPADSSKGSKALDIPGNIPQSGDESLAKKDAEVLRGKLVKVEDQMYTLETSPGKQVSIRSGQSTKFESDYKGMTGDWIEALVTPDMHLQSLKKSTPAYIVEGSVLKVEKDSLVVKDSSGKEIRLRMGKDAKIQGSHKVGDSVKAVFTPEGEVLSIKPAKAPIGPEGA
jgi:hypothetical protein